MKESDKFKELLKKKRREAIYQMSEKLVSAKTGIPLEDMRETKLAGISIFKSLVSFILFCGKDDKFIYRRRGGRRRYCWLLTSKKVRV